MSVALRYLLIALAFALAACDVGEIDPIQIAINAQRAGRDPCKDPQLRARVNVRARRYGHLFVGTNGNDVIFGTNGNDIIYGRGGDDVICAFGGDDYIDGGAGRDRIYAGAGADIVHGRAGSDRIWGGPGPDVLFGDLLDDHLHGGDGNDTLIGGHGTDVLDGGPGNDYLRGDTGNDTFIGGPGNDVASFATALPPGQPEVLSDNTENPITGVAVGATQANGDGGHEALHGIEQVVGSPFTDRFAPGRTVQPTPGETTPTPVSTVYIAAGLDAGGRLADVGVVVLGSPGPDDLRIEGTGTVVTVVGASALTAGDGCSNPSPTTVRCDVGAYIAARPHRPHPFHYVLGWGGNGSDRIQLSGTFPREFEAHVSGGRGSDHLIGGDEADVFFTGVTGNDHLEGNGGDDALIGESQHTLGWAHGARPDTAFYNDGADILDGGPGDDQLVVDYVCGGHTFIGGPGHDIAGFARSGNPGIHAQLGGPSHLKTRWWGFAANMTKCGNRKDRWTHWKTGPAADLEVLEASDGPDYLWGDDRADTIWGRGGGDHIYGLGGDDELLGADGNDVIVGGGGNDTISYGRDH